MPMADRGGGKLPAVLLVHGGSWTLGDKRLPGEVDIAERLARHGYVAFSPDYRLIKELWAFAGNRIAVRYAYEYHDDSGHWFRAYGNENWEFAEDGLMHTRHSSINEHPIAESERKFLWPLGRRPDDHPGLSHFGF